MIVFKMCQEWVCSRW